MTCSFRYPETAVLARVVFGRLAGVMRRIESVSVSDVRVVSRLLVLAGFMMLDSFTMMGCCPFVMFCRLLVVLRNLGGLP